MNAAEDLLTPAAMASGAQGAFSWGFGVSLGTLIESAAIAADLMRRLNKRPGWSAPIGTGVAVRSQCDGALTNVVQPTRQDMLNAERHRIEGCRACSNSGAPRLTSNDLWAPAHHSL